MFWVLHKLVFTYRFDVDIACPAAMGGLGYSSDIIFKILQLIDVLLVDSGTAMLQVYQTMQPSASFCGVMHSVVKDFHNCHGALIK